MTAPERPMPDTTDPVVAEFWASAREQILVVQQCGDCGDLRWPPRRVCPRCLAAESGWVPVSGRGTLYSYADYRRALDPAFAAEVPYVVALVELDEGPRMYGRLLGPVSTQDIGRAVTACFQALSADVTLVAWRLERATPTDTEGGRTVKPVQTGGRSR